MLNEPAPAAEPEATDPAAEPETEPTPAPEDDDAPMSRREFKEQFSSRQKESDRKLRAAVREAVTAAIAGKTPAQPGNGNTEPSPAQPDDHAFYRETTDALLEAGIHGPKVRLARAALRELRDPGEPIEDTIERLKEAEPSWFGGVKETKRPGGTPGGRNQGTLHEDFSEAGLEKAAESMKPDEYRAWRRKNRAKIMAANGLAKRWNPGGNLLGAGQRKG